MWYSTSESNAIEESQLLAGNAHVCLSSLLKLRTLCLVFLLGTGNTSIALETPTVEHNGDKITFVTSDANVQTIIHEQADFPSIDEAITKVIPNHLIFYRSNNGTHKVHTVIEITDDAQQTDATQIPSLNATIPSTSVKPKEPPQIESPASGSAVDGKKVQISWNSGNRVINDWYLHVSTLENGKNLVDSGDMSPETTSYLVDNLPQNESTVYVKLWYQERAGSKWHNIKSTFLSNAVKPEPPKVDSPATGSSVNGKQTKIAWNAGNKKVSKWSLYVSTTENGKNLADSGEMPSETTSYLVDNLPQDGSTIHVNLRYQEHGSSAWNNARTTFSSAEVAYGEDLIALYDFDGDLTDTSGNELHGTSPTPLKFQSTPDGRSTVHFDGVNDHIILGRSNKLDFSASKSFTIATWIRLPDTSPLFTDNDVFMNLISKYDKEIAGEYYLDLRRSGKVGLLREAAPFDKQSSNRIKPNQFSLVVGTYDGTAAKVYVDGELSGTTPMGPSRSAGNTDVVLGARHKRGTLENYFQGEMDKLLIYDRALTELEVLSMFKEIPN